MNLVEIASAIALLCAAAHAQSTTRLSSGPGGVQANGNSVNPAISADARYVAFHSFASNLVAGDGNGVGDVFVLDRVAGSIERVSVSSSGVQGDFASFTPSITDDGRSVAFFGGSDNLVPGDTNDAMDVFVRDRASGTTARASVSTAGAQGNDHSQAPVISPDGRYVAFESDATNFVAGDTNGCTDVFVRDRASGTTERVSVSSAGAQGSSLSFRAAITPDGRYVAFLSAATNLVAGDTNLKTDVFVRDRQTGTTMRVSVGPGGVQADDVSNGPFLSSDGRFVVFYSLATNLVPGDTNGFGDVFVHDRQTATTSRLSVDSNGGQSDGDSYAVSISPDARFVAFFSHATLLVGGDSNTVPDVFVHDRVAHATTRASVASSGGQANDQSQTSSISASGRYVAFQSGATNLVAGDTNGFIDVFLRDAGAASAFVPFCFGPSAGPSTTCPCHNGGAPGHGCQNSLGTGGAVLSVIGNASLSADTVFLRSMGELSTAFSIVLQGSAAIEPVFFGDGLRCAGGTLKRLYSRNASSGVLIVPQSGDPSISARSAALGDPIPLGATRAYQFYYRDPNAAFCPGPPGGSFNASNAMAIAWDG